VSAGTIDVLAGVNGAGKSSVLGEAFIRQGARFFNPDFEAKRLLADGAAATLAEANGLAWQLSKMRLEEAVATGGHYAFETTLGGKSITAVLKRSAQEGVCIRITYIGLASVDLHIGRVRHRVAKGGHDIPAELIRSRYQKSRLNLIELLPHIEAVRVFDNSFDASEEGVAPRPELLLECRQRNVVRFSQEAPAWAKPIIAAAIDVDVNRA
jgi:predicted ABC-type ATPase